MNIITLEEEHSAGKISSNDFLYLLLAKTEIDIIQTDLSQTENDGDKVEYWIPTPCISDQTQEFKENKNQRIQFLTKIRLVRAKTSSFSTHPEVVRKSLI